MIQPKGHTVNTFYSLSLDMDKARAEVYRFKRETGARFDQVKAEYTGEYRERKEGEWFLSGAQPRAYYSPATINDGQKWFIARLVCVKEMKSFVKF